MNVTFSQSADAILSRQRDFRDSLVQALGGLPGNCFIDGKVGRSPPDDSLVLMCQNRQSITVQSYEFEGAATVEAIVKQWSSPPHE